MNYFQYRPTYAGVPIKEASDLADHARQVYNVRQEEYNVLNETMANFRGIGKDANDYINSIKDNVSKSIDNLAKDANGNIKWHEANNMVRDLALKVTSDEKLQHIQENYIAKKEDELNKKKLIQEGKEVVDFREDFNEQEFTNFDEEGNPISYTPRFQAKKDWFKGGQKAIDLLRPKLQMINERLSGALQGRVEGQREFLNSRDFQQELEALTDVALDQEELGQLAALKGRDGVKSFLTKMVTANQYDYREGKIIEDKDSKSNTSSGASMTDLVNGNLTIMEDLAPTINNEQIEITPPEYIEKYEEISTNKEDESFFDKVWKDIKKTGNQSIYAGATMHVHKLESDRFTKEQISQMEKDFTVQSLLDSNFENLSTKEKINTIKRQYESKNEDFLQLAQGLNLYSRQLKFDVNPDLFEGAAKTSVVGMNERGKAYVEGAADSKDQKPLGEILQEVYPDFDVTDIKDRTATGIYISNSNSDAKYDGGIRIQLTDKNNNTAYYVVPNERTNRAVAGLNNLYKEQVEVARNPKITSEKGNVGKTKIDLMYLLKKANPDSDSEFGIGTAQLDNLSEDEIALINKNGLTVSPYARMSTEVQEDGQERKQINRGFKFIVDNKTDRLALKSLLLKLGFGSTDFYLDKNEVILKNSFIGATIQDRLNKSISNYAIKKID